MADCVFSKDNKGKTQRRPEGLGVQNRRIQTLGSRARSCSLSCGSHGGQERRTGDPPGCDWDGGEEEDEEAGVREESIRGRVRSPQHGGG